MDCDYARIFEPSAIHGLPSGFADVPRPFVLRVHHLDGRTVEPGEAFEILVHLFDIGNPRVDAFTRTFEELAGEGFGPGRGRAAIKRVRAPELVCVPLSAGAEAVRRATVQFVTPTELKHGGTIVDRPDFGVLMARARDRLSTLAALYGDGPLELDFADFARRASHVTIASTDLRYSDVTRRSSRTGQSHGIGGFTGTVEYEGDLSEFLPFLEAAKLTGVGRHTTWGNGELFISAR